MITLKGLEKTENIKWDINFNNISSSPEFLTNVHSVLFDGENFGQETAFDKKLALSTSIDWNGANMPQTAKYLGLDHIELNSTAELIDIIEQICQKANKGKLASDVIINVITRSDNQPIVNISITPKQAGHIKIIFPEGLSQSEVEYDSDENEQRTIELCNDDYYIEYSTNKKFENLTFNVTLTPTDDRYSKCVKDEQFDLPYIFIESIKFKNIDTTYTVDTNKGEQVSNYINQLKQNDGMFLPVTVEWSNVITKEIPYKDISSTEGYNIQAFKNINRQNKVDISNVLNNVGTYYIFGVYNNNVYTSNYITVNVADDSNIVNGIKLIGDTNIIIKDTPVSKTYTVYTINKNGRQLDEISNNVTFIITDSTGITTYNQNANVILYNSENNYTIKATYDYEGATYISNILEVTVTEQEYQYFIITESTDENYITASGSSSYTEIANRLYDDETIEETIRYTFNNIPTYLYIVLPEEYTLLSVTGEQNADFKLNMAIYDGTKYDDVNNNIINGHRLYRSMNKCRTNNINIKIKK